MIKKILMASLFTGMSCSAMDVEQGVRYLAYEQYEEYLQINLQKLWNGIQDNQENRQTPPGAKKGHLQFFWEGQWYYVPKPIFTQDIIMRERDTNLLPIILNFGQ